MSYYIDKSGLFIEKNGADFRLAKGLLSQSEFNTYKLATDEEVEAFLNPPKSTEELQEIETQWRDSQLKSTDEFGLDDYPDNELRASMRAYRQKLRDYPSIEGFGDELLRPADPRS